jgi:hypothetical protein
MDEAIRRRLNQGGEPSDESEAERESTPGGLRGLSDHLSDGYAGVRALQASAWEAPADLEWGEAEDGWAVEPTVEAERAASRLNVRTLALAAGIFLLSALPRLFVIFFVTDPQNPGLGWYGDTFHHWQIAYLSKEIGFSEGFLRLWDLKGLEFFWGVLHPLLLAGLFDVTGSVSIVIPRLVSALAASVCMPMFFFLLKRHFNRSVAIAGVLLAVVNPVAVFSDGVGMQEPLGLIFLLGGMLLWPRQMFWTGACFSVAGMVRSEYWVFGAGLTLVGLLSNYKVERKIALAVGWLIPSLAYARYLMSWTGNPIYPVYWNFMGNAAGAWMIEAPLIPDRVIARGAGRVVLVLAAAAALWVWRAKKGHSLFLLLGLGNMIFLGLMWGVSSYIHGFIPRFVYDRLLVVPYLYLGFFVAIALFHALPARLPGRIFRWASWAVVVLLAGLSQLAWIPLMGYYDGIRPMWDEEQELAKALASRYQGGTIAIPEDRPAMVYALVYNHGISGRNLEGQMYDPFSYIQSDPFADWANNRLLLEDWFARRDIQLLAFYSGKYNYEQMVEREPAWFQRLGSGFRDTIKIYQVTIG